MPASLSIMEINDPHEFTTRIQKDQNQYLYVYIDDIFKPIGDIYTIANKIYSEYLCSLIFSDIRLYNEQENVISNQLFQDIDQTYNPQRIIYSPIMTRYLPLKLQVYDNIQYHSYSFILQIIKSVLPWHIPTVGFEAKINQEIFSKLSSDSIWALQHVTS